MGAAWCKIIATCWDRRVLLVSHLRDFRDRYAVAQKDMIDNRKVYGYKITEYMAAAFKKARLHRVTPVGSMERRYEVMCRDKAQMGGRREKHV